MHQKDNLSSFGAWRKENFHIFASYESIDIFWLGKHWKSGL